MGGREFEAENASIEGKGAVQEVPQEQPHMQQYKVAWAKGAR